MNTPKNGVFYPRIQSILAYFLEIKKWRKWREVCRNVCVREFLCLLALSALATYCYGRPPTSCRVFLIRTLDPPPSSSSRTQRQNEDKNRPSFYHLVPLDPPATLNVSTPSGKPGG
jgi:hypothetical protein